MAEDDPKGLIADSYSIEGISMPECRSIFLDWALSIKSAETSGPIRRLLAQYEAGAPTHPMTLVLKEGLTAAPARGRRGGRAGRLS